MTLSPGDVKSISATVYRKFPELTGVIPSVNKQSIPNTKKSSKTNHTYSYLLTYKSVVSMPGGHTMHKIVRVVVNNKGKVLKMTSSK